MPINPDAVGETGGPATRSWTSKDALLYAVGIGAGTDELEFTTENTSDRPQRVFPTFAVIIGGGGLPMDKVGSFNPALMVHGEQGIELLDEIPPDGQLESRGRIAGIWDKGSAALIELESEAVNAATGKPLLRTRASLFCRGEGGWGGDRGPSEKVEYPDAEPTHQVTYATREDQALTYRLSGDRNPLHSDPSFAAMGGFDRPILHGLCTYGFTGARAPAHTLRQPPLPLPLDERTLLAACDAGRCTDGIHVGGREPCALSHDQPGRRRGHRPGGVHVRPMSRVSVLTRIRRQS